MFGSSLHVVPGSLLRVALLGALQRSLPTLHHSAILPVGIKYRFLLQQCEPRIITLTLMGLPSSSVKLKAGIGCREITYQTRKSVTTLPFCSDFQSPGLFSCLLAGWLLMLHEGLRRNGRLQLLVFHTPSDHSQTGSHKRRQTPSCTWHQSQGILLVLWSKVLCSFYLCKFEQQELQATVM